MRHLRLQRHYKLLLLLALVVALLIVGAGDQRIVAYSLQDTEKSTPAVINYGHTPAALVEAVPESIQIPGSVQAASPTGSE
jgi:hypothetical protein